LIPPLTAIAEPATVRLVSTAYFKPPVLKALVDSDEELETLAELEGLTNRRLKAERTGTADLDPRELLYAAWGKSYVNAAFAYTRKEGNRFNDARRGAWYAAFEDLTALEEVAWHRTRELRRIDRFHDQAVYQALLAGFIGDFHDLREVRPQPACLDPDPDVGYSAGQQLARDLRAGKSRGLIYPSVRKRGGTCLVAFEPHAVQNVRPGPRWRLSWSGSPAWSATTG
jgi:RES domain-containing protein